MMWHILIFNFKTETSFKESDKKASCWCRTASSSRMKIGIKGIEPLGMLKGKFEIMISLAIALGKVSGGIKILIST